MKKYTFPLKNIEFTFAFTGGSSDPGTILGMGLSGRLLASLGCLAQPRLLFAVWLGCLAQKRLRSRFWPAAADRLFIHPCLPCDGPGGTQIDLPVDRAHSTGP